MVTSNRTDRTVKGCCFPEKNGKQCANYSLKCNTTSTYFLNALAALKNLFCSMGENIRKFALYSRHLVTLMHVLISTAENKVSLLK